MDSRAGGAIFLPTLGVGMEQALIHDLPALMAAFRAFNRWMEEDWGFAYQRPDLRRAVHHSVDPDNAVASCSGRSITTPGSS